MFNDYHYHILSPRGLRQEYVMDGGHILRIESLEMAQGYVMTSPALTIQDCNSLYCDASRMPDKAA